MQITINGDHHRLRLTVGDSEPRPHEVRIDDEREARVLLSRCEDDASALRRLRSFTADIEPWARRDRSDAQLLAAYTRWVAAERVALWLELPPERETVSTAVDADEIEPLLLEPEPELSRVAFQVLEQGSGTPIPGIQLSIELPDGSTQDHETDDDGLIDIRDIPPGVCAVRSERGPRHRGQSVAFTGFGYFVPSNLRGRPEGWQRGTLGQLRTTEPVNAEDEDLVMVEVIEHRVATGDTLESMAEAYGVEVDDITEFNWGTTEPREVQRALASEVGCSRRDPETREFVFSDDDAPGIVLVPLPFERTDQVTDTRHILQVKRFEVKSSWVFSL